MSMDKAMSQTQIANRQSVHQQAYMRSNRLTFLLCQGMAALAFVFLSLASFAQDLSTPPHASTTIPLSARYEIVQSQLAARWTFRLDRVCGQVAIMVRVNDKGDDLAWDGMEVIGSPKCVVDGKIRYQLFTSGLAVRHTMLMNTDNGKTWMLSGYKDAKSGDRSVWAPLSE